MCMRRRVHPHTLAHVYAKATQREGERERGREKGSGRGKERRGEREGERCVEEPGLPTKLVNFVSASCPYLINMDLLTQF